MTVLTMSTTPTARVLGADDVSTLRQLLAGFADAFEDDQTYLARQPGDAYLEELLSDRSFVAIAGYCDGSVVGALAGYVLHKFEQERSEFYLYDLAVLEMHRRNGVATAMIERLKAMAADRGAWVIFVQADYGDDAAVALYSKLGVKEEVMHFDIQPSTTVDRPQPFGRPSRGSRGLK